MDFDGTYVAYEESGMRQATTVSVVSIFGGTPKLFDPGTSDGPAYVNVVNGKVFWTEGSSSGNNQILNTVSSPATSLSPFTVVSDNWSGFPTLAFSGLAVDSAGQSVYNMEILSNKYSIEVTPASSGVTSNFIGDQSGIYNDGQVLGMGLSLGANPAFVFYTVAASTPTSIVALEEFNLNTGVNDTLLALTNVANNGGPFYYVSDGTYVYYFEPAVNPNAPTIIRLAQGQPVAAEPAPFYSPGLQATATSSLIDALAYDQGNLYFAHSKPSGIWYIDYVPVGGGNVAAGTATNLYTAPSGYVIGSVRARNGYVVWEQTNMTTSNFVPEIWAIRHP
jgi:hypothetical protein